jgi:hypothetical protein
VDGGPVGLQKSHSEKSWEKVKAHTHSTQVCSHLLGFPSKKNWLSVLCQLSESLQQPCTWPWLSLGFLETASGHTATSMLRTWSVQVDGKLHSYDCPWVRRSQGSGPAFITACLQGPISNRKGLRVLNQVVPIGTCVPQGGAGFWLLWGHPRGMIRSPSGTNWDYTFALSWPFKQRGLAQHRHHSQSVLQSIRSFSLPWSQLDSRGWYHCPIPDLHVYALFHVLIPHSIFSLCELYSPWLT